jgi:hypothetical protein
MKTNTQNFKTAFATAMLATLSLGSVALAQSAATPPAATPGYLADFDYQVTNFSTYEEAAAAMNLETTETLGKSICENRAEVWSYMMNKTLNINVGKVFILFTDQSDPKEDTEWAFHVAPYVLINGQEYVLDTAFDVFDHMPKPLGEWTTYFSKVPDCAVLDPIHNPDDLAMEANNLAPHQYPVTNGHICYLRKMPMYYISPVTVYKSDLAMAQGTTNNFLETSFDKEDVLSSCRQAMGRGLFSDPCMKYLGFAKPSN